ncbi:poly(A)-specific ribonuclease [Pneumocystis jirovecii RU7]|uniref:PAN2-PAN3 deadenylation complex catalytic subunit PAN2 n=1 Tax=Pneumocystis jirovecii (strain RU7) TaxID=1408657 RepID=A0A0W4ZGR5_PNEJ7|nr:poly(A)-specific ribonuclease [Pneumocystis jirovecii RU7]KTW27568.1 hypothetical protein T551_03067 [Pneumocystis jirovecii RU7]
MTEWTQIAYSSIHQHGSKIIPITTSCFDEYYELVWVGNEKGHLTSYFGPELCRYTSAKAHNTPICSLISHERGIVSLSSQNIRLMNRRGLFRWSLSDLDMIDLQCMTVVSRTSSDILVGGLQTLMLLVNIERGTVINKLVIGGTNRKKDTVVMQCGRYICCGSSTGELSLLDPSSYKELHSIEAHSGSFSDLDIRGNLILTCGFSQRNEHYLLDPLVKVFDIRTLRPLVPVPFPAGPAYVKMHPKMSTTAFVVSQNGLFHIVDMGNTTDVQLRHASTNTYFTSFCVSQSGDALALSDADGAVQLWSQKLTPCFSEFSGSLEWPNTSHVPNIRIHTDTPLNVIGMPYYREELLSSWPSHLVYDVGKVPHILDQDAISNMKMMDFVGYSIYSGNMKRNQARYYTRDKDDGIQKLIAPKFHSEKAKELVSGDMKKDSVPLYFEDEDNDSTEPFIIPKFYKLLEIKYSKFGVEDFDFGYYNNTPFSGLEIHIENSYCNSLIQLYYFIPSIRELAVAHSVSSCAQEKCLLCEIGFLFKMLSDANGQNCQATNFLRVLSASSQAISLGLIINESMEKKISFSSIIQALNRFLLEKLSDESLNTHSLNNYPSTNISPLAETNGFFSKTITFCGCGANSVRDSIIFVIDFIYPKIASGKKFSLASFSLILGASINREVQNRAWCSNCHQFRFLTTQRTVSNFPCYLNINAMAYTQDHWKYWSSKGWLPTKIGLNHHLGKVVCFQGKDIDKKVNNEGLTIYNLKGLVVEISFKNESHLVSFIHVTDKDIELKYKTSWFLFNDFLVMSVPEDHVLNFSKAWKVPAILIYEKVNYSDDLKKINFPSFDMSVLYKDCSISLKRDMQFVRHQIFTEIEKLDHNTVIGLDAEFVSMQKEEINVRSDGTRFIVRPSKLLLARVSAVRGNGELENVPFIDDYIAINEPIVDYLTEFSGIKQGDLDPITSKYTLVPLKIAYKKLRLLVTLGCKFVGHGLQKDFRIINIHVPKNQVIDTVNLFYLENRQRKLSLRFLAWYLLQDYIQQDSHDSIEDARTALLLYKKYKEFKEQGIFEEKLKEIYDLGKKYGYKPPVVGEEKHTN